MQDNHFNYSMGFSLSYLDNLLTKVCYLLETVTSHVKFYSLWRSHLMYSKIGSLHIANKPREPINVEGVDIKLFDMKTGTSTTRPF